MATVMLDPEIEALIGGATHAPSVSAPSPSVTVDLSRQTGGDLVMTGAEQGFSYEGASRYDQSLAFWSPGIQSADSEILPNKGESDARVRDRGRNDSYIAGGVGLHKDGIVGSFFLLNAKPATLTLGARFDSKWEEEFQAEVEESFTLGMESPDCWVDASRRNTLTEMVRLGVGVFATTGEVLASVEWLRDGGRPFNTAIQMIDTDRLSTPPTLMYNNFGDYQKIRGGVERDMWGAPVAYHIRTFHPSDWMNGQTPEWKRVEARKPWGRLQIIHLFESMRVDQSRGISEMVTALKEIKITKKFRDVVLQNAILNATYAASIESDLPTDAAFAALGGGEDLASAMNQYMGAWMSQVAAYSGGAKNLQIDGVKIPHLLPGTKLQLRPAGNGGPLGSDFEKSLLRYIAANLGVSYEQLSKDYSSTNYSSARAAMNETWKFMQSRKKIVADRMATIIYRLWLEEQINKGLISSMPKVSQGWLYEGQNLDALSACEWIGAGRGQVDELKETHAALLRIEGNLSTREREMARMHGADWRRDFKQIAREKALAEKYGVDLTITQTGTGNQNAGGGNPQGSGAQGRSFIGVESEDNIDAQ